MPRLLAFLFASALMAQYPQYPGGRYPGGQYPGGQYPEGTGIPFPRRSKKTTQQNKPDQPLPNFAGKLQRIDSKAIVVELDDNRVLEFRRTGKTTFVNVKESALKPGDHISVEATQDAEGYMTAVNVHLEAAANTTEAPPQQGVGAQPPAAAAAPAPAAKPAPEDDSAKAVEEQDPDRPVLRRGKPQHKAHSTVEPEAQPEAAPAQTASAKPRGPARATPAAETTPAVDPVIEKARTAAAAFSETLPNYVVQEFMSRYASETRTPEWRPLDVVSCDVVYENGKENYRNLKINSKPVKEGMEQMTGSWSTGEFGTMLLDLLSPMTAARFRYRKPSTIGGRDALVYDYTVDRENSHWLVKVASQSVEPAYRGAVWIDKETSRILRIEMEAVGLPEAFPLDHVESAADYGFVRLGTTAQFLLPVHAETLSCQRGSFQCSQNKIDFRNYHKYTGESSITFDK